MGRRARVLGMHRQAQKELKESWACIDKLKRNFHWKRLASYSIDPNLHELAQLLVFWHGCLFSTSFCRVTLSASLHRLVPSLLCVLGDVQLGRLCDYCRESRMCPWMFIIPFWIPQTKCGICLQSVIISGLFRGNIECRRINLSCSPVVGFCLGTIRMQDPHHNENLYLNKEFKISFLRHLKICFFTPLIWIWQQRNSWGLQFQW